MLWGTTGTSQALLGPGTTPVGVGATRLLIGAVALLAGATMANRGALVGVFTRRRLPWLVGGGAGIVAYQLTFFNGVARTGVATGTLIMLATAPLVAGLVGWVVLRDRLILAWAAGTLIALAGCALLVAGAGAAVRVDPLGVASAVGAGVSFAVYSVCGRVLMTTGVDPLTGAAAVFGVGLLGMLVPLATADLSWVWTPRSLAILAWLGVGATALAYLLYQRGLATVPAAVASTLALAEPMTASLLAVLVLREPMTPVSAAGLLLVLVGLAAVGLLSSRRRPARRAP